MVQYVEFLRAKRSIFVVAIILAILFVIAIVIRASAHDHHHGSHNWRDYLHTSPAAHVTNQTMPDGSTRTVVDDPVRHKHAVIVQHGNDFRIDVDEPASRNGDNESFAMGNMHIVQTRDGKMQHVTITLGNEFTIPLAILLLASVPFGLLVATMLGGALAKENDGHLELAWTKPASREEVALLAMAIDAAAILVAEAFAIAVYLCCILLFGVPTFDLTNHPGLAVLMTIVAPISWYAALTAWSSSLKTHLGMVIGIGWPAALLVPGLAHALHGARTPVGQDFYAIFHGLSYIDPIAYLSFGPRGVSNGLVPTMDWAIVALAALAAIYLISAVLQWRRVEA